MATKLQRWCGGYGTSKALWVLKLQKRCGRYGTSKAVWGL